MSSGGLQKTSDGITQSLLAMLDRGRSAGAYLDRVVWPKYQAAQIQRWETENASQGDTWKQLNPDYEKKKKVKFAAYPGAGQVKMVATSRLAQGAQGRNTEYFMRTVDESSIQVAINLSTLPYASYAAKSRPFMSFSAATLDEWTHGLAAYVMRGDE